MEFDVPWTVRWDVEFETAVETLKESGRWDHVLGRIEKIIENPVRTGRYKDGTLKGIRTTHVGEQVIGWEVTPGVNADMQHKVEEVYFHFVVHHDDMGIGFTRPNPVERSPTFRVTLPYYGGFEMEAKIHDVFQVAKPVDRFRVKDPDWRPEEVVLEGVVPPEDRDVLESVLPEAAEVGYDDPSLLG